VEIRPSHVAPTKIFNPTEKIFGATCSAFALGFNKKNIIKSDRKKINNAILQYFYKAQEYLNFNNEEKEDQFNKWCNTFAEYCKCHLLDFLSSVQEYKESKDDFMIFILLDEPSLEDYRILHDNYFNKNIFNKEEYSLPDQEGIIHGVPDSLYTYNPKKTFLQHQSGPITLNYRTLGRDAKVIWQFYQLAGRRNKKLRLLWKI